MKPPIPANTPAYNQSACIAHENTYICIPPLIQRAKAILQQRLVIKDEHQFILDGAPVSIRDIVHAANAFVRLMGGVLLNYPGLHSRYDRDAPQMRIRQLLL